jgi:hypothetical protein
VVLFGVLRFVLAMVGVVARVVIKVKIDIKNGIEIFNFIKGGKFDILLAPHYNTVKKV